MGRPKGERGHGGKGGKGRGHQELSHHAHEGASRRRPPTQLDYSHGFEPVPFGTAASNSLGPRHPITPLGLPSTPPPLPALPAVFTNFDAPVSTQEYPHQNGDHEQGDREKADRDKRGGAERSGDWTPPEKLMEKADRRTFFHTGGKEHSFTSAKTDGKKYGDPQKECAVGSMVELAVDEVHFGQPRVGMRGDPEVMGKMIKWPADKFDEYTLECAQISFGNDYWVWSAANIRSNRILYAMKRVGAKKVKANCVPPPPLPEPEEDIDLTYGASIQGIQLVP